MKDIYDKIIPELIERGYTPEVTIENLEDNSLISIKDSMIILPKSLEGLTEEESSNLKEGKLLLKPSRLKVDFVRRKGFHDRHCPVYVNFGERKASSLVDNEDVAEVFRKYGWTYKHIEPSIR